MQPINKKALLAFQHALKFMAALFRANGVLSLQQLVQKFQQRLESGEKINPADISNKGTFGDVLLSPENGCKITRSQEVWVNTAFHTARSLAQTAATYLWTYERTLVKEDFTTAAGPGVLELIGAFCSRCGTGCVRQRDLEPIASEFWARAMIGPLIESGKISEALSEALECGSCFQYAAAVNRILKERNIQPVDGSIEQCPSCGSAVRYAPIEISWNAAEHAIEANRM